MASTDYNKYPFWTARFWHGMRLGDWLRLAADYKFRISPSRWPMAAIITMMSVVNSCGSGWQGLWQARRIKEAEVPPPIFIVGHWRSGTTMLHELMTCDERFNFPTTYQCFAPHHFLISQWWAPRLLWFLAPKQRPMDNMSAGMNLPQEDEFALMNLGIPSPYRRMAFPNEPARHVDYLDFEGVGSRAKAEWSRRLQWFARALTVSREGRLVFKSPTHTGRVALLAELFPGAKFIHISRHPHSLYPSTMRLWKALDTVQGLQAADTGEEAESQRQEYVLTCLERMYSNYPQETAALEENQFYQVSYEDLVSRPLEIHQEIYEQLQLPDFEHARPNVEAYWEQRKDYSPNPHPELPEDVQEKIRRRWGNYAEMYGYDLSAS